MSNERANQLQPIRTLHLFAGCGGGILADLLLGHRTIGAVEISPYRRQVLAQRQRDGILPFFPIFDDVTDFDGTEWRGVTDAVCGGFPCQDIAAAGPGTGIAGSRSGLWKHMGRIIGQIQPRFVFVENSPILTSRGLGVVLGDLAAMGYDARWGVIGVGDSGGLHERNRIWIFAFANTGEKRVQRFKPKAIHRQQGFSWCKNVRGLEDLRNRPDIPSPKLCRKGNELADHVERIMSIGDGQCPTVAALAWRILSEGLI